MTVGGLAVSVVRKRIKNLHLGVYPPLGRVRVAAPHAISDDAIRLAVIDKLGWIKRQRSKFQHQPRQSRRELVAGETHYFMGRRYRLKVVETLGRPKIAPQGIGYLVLFVRSATTATQRDALLAQWYRDQLKAFIAPLIHTWQQTLGVTARGWGIKRMRTKWGSCTLSTRRLWFNTELAKKSPDCIEYIVVHELLHLIERRHGDRFIDLLNRHLPRWTETRARLNAAPLGHENWR